MPTQNLPLQPSKRHVPPEEKDTFLSWVQTFLNDQRTLILASCQESTPACNLMCFGFMQKKCSLVLVTPENTRKCRAMRHNPNVSLLAADSRALNQDLQGGTAVTLNARAQEIQDHGRQKAEEAFIVRNPDLKDFASSSQSVLFGIDVYHVVAVSNFQELTELYLEDACR